VEYSFEQFPHAYCLEPELTVLAKGRRLPHVYTHTEPVFMCLFPVGPSFWHNRLWLSDIVIPQIFLWLANFEEWLFCGTWRGGGTHSIPFDPPKRTPQFPGDVGLLSHPLTGIAHSGADERISA
jgi:hypothetical protein